MRLNTTSIKKSIPVCFVVGCGAIICLLAIIISSVYVHVGEARALSESQLDKFAQNNILFYDPGSSSSTDCVSGGICGGTAVQKYWSLLRGYFGEEQVAGIMGNIPHEGDFNPVAWESKATDSSGHFRSDYSWDKLYNECWDSCYVGVGSVQITSSLSKYLHFVNEEAPDLLEYFKNPEKYGFNWSYPKDGKFPGDGKHYGDQALEVIGDRDFSRLIEIEMRFIMEESIGPGGFYGDLFNMDTFKALTTANDAGRYWASHYERCAGCEGESVQSLRGGEADIMFGLMSGFSCSGSDSTLGSSVPDVVNTEITLIGDSISVMSEKELTEKFPNAYMTMVDGRHPTSAGGCSQDNTEGGLGILRDLVSGSGTVAVQHWNQENGTCDSEVVNSSSLKKNIVWELGTNTTGATRETIQDVIELIGNHRNLYLVTPYNGNSENNDMMVTDQIVDMYREFAGDYSNVYIVDWNKTVRDDSSKYIDSDGINPTVEGRKLLPDLIAEVIVSSGNDVDYGACGDIDVSGGLNESQMEKLRDYYNGPEVDVDYYTLPAGLKDNCVSFPAFFVQKFTSIGLQPHRAWGHGGDTAHDLAEAFDLPQGNEPRPFAVFSNWTSSSTNGWGHTGVVVAVEGDDIITLEAMYQSSMATIYHHTSDFFVNSKHNYKFTYLDSVLDTNELFKVVGR